MTEWEFNSREGNVDLYSDEGDFVDSFNFADTCQHFVDEYLQEYSSEYQKADIQDGWVVFYAEDGTEISKEPVDTLVDYHIEQKDQHKEEPAVEPENQTEPVALSQPPLVGT